MVKKTKKEEIQETPRSEEKVEKEQKAGGEDDLSAKLQEKEKEATDNYDKYVRAVAELENYKKRALRERTDSIKYGNENIIKDILPLVDNLDRALQHTGNSGDFEAFKEGLKMLQDQLLCTLEKHGVQRSNALIKTLTPMSMRRCFRSTVTSIMTIKLLRSWREDISSTGGY